jgi:hypothetical protein
MDAQHAADFSRRFVSMATAAITAGAMEAMGRFMRGEDHWSPDVLKATVEKAVGPVELLLNGRVVLTPRARASVVETLALIGYNVAAALNGKEPA